MDDEEYKRLLKAYEDDKAKENSQKSQQNNTNSYSSNNSAFNYDEKDREIERLRRQVNYYQNERMENHSAEKHQKQAIGDSKKGVGFVCGFFLGIIGLIIGLFMYQDYERETFLKGWGSGFGTVIAVGLIVGLIYYFAVMSMVNDIMNSF